MKNKSRYLRLLPVIVLAVYLLLMIPSGDSPLPEPEPGAKPFAWNRDAEWASLESDFALYKSAPGQSWENKADSIRSILDSCLSLPDLGLRDASDPCWDTILSSYLHLAPLVAVSPSRYQWYSSVFMQTRALLKHASRTWHMEDEQVRSSMYKVLYGMRTAQEEVALQMPPRIVPDLVAGTNERSVTDSVKIFGVTVHSGDILVSRGGADVSAFIARGNDYPGNFSHIALMYIDSISHRPYLVEAHIEKGVAVSSVDDYVSDTKRRFMVLRPRADLPVMQLDPWLPHRAAKYLFDEAHQRHIPYDFSLDYADHSAMFCSEVASAAYTSQGIRTWQRLSVISSQGVRQWLHDFGVSHFNTQMPSDLEYDPQFTVVAEWRDMETLYLDHIDNAVMDAWYESAEKGSRIGYKHWKLPLARLIKAYCLFLNAINKAGLIPEGMSATQALRNERFSAMHKKVKESVLAEARQFQQAKGYRPPYWKLLEMARKKTK